MEDCSATRYGLISRNRPYQDLQTVWLNLAGTQPRLFSAAKVPRRRNESLPRAGKKKKKISAASACRSASAPRIWNQALTFSMFPIFAAASSASALLPRHAYGLTALLLATVSVNKQTNKIHGVTGCHENTRKLFFMTSGVQ